MLLYQELYFSRGKKQEPQLSFYYNIGFQYLNDPLHQNEALNIKAYHGQAVVLHWQ